MSGPSGEVEAAFNEAKAAAESLGEVSTKDRLRLYALYKQALVGDAPAAGPSRLQLRDHAKWTAWRVVAGTSRADAMLEYARLVDGLCAGGPMGEDGAEDGYAEDDDAAEELEAALMANVGSAVFSMPALPEGAEEGRDAHEGAGAAPHAASGHAGQAFRCAQAGDVDGLRRLLDPGRTCCIDVSAGDEDGRTLLHWAADRGHLAAVEFLLDEGGARLDVNARDGEGQTALHMAAVCDHEEVMAALLAGGADERIADEDGQTALAHVQPEARARLHAAAAAYAAHADERRRASRKGQGPAYEEREAAGEGRGVTASAGSLPRCGHIAWTVVAAAVALASMSVSLMSLSGGGAQGIAPLTPASSVVQPSAPEEALAEDPERCGVSPALTGERHDAARIKP